MVLSNVWLGQNTYFYIAPRAVQVLTKKKHSDAALSTQMNWIVQLSPLKT